MPEDPPGLQLAEAVRPLRERALELVELGAELSRAAHGQPFADPAAAREIAEEHPYAGAWGPEPLRSAHSIAGMSLAAAEDHLRLFCRVLIPEPGASFFQAPVFGHTMLASGCVESAARAAWLLDPSASYLQRATRAMAEHLHSSRPVAGRLMFAERRPSRTL